MERIKKALEKAKAERTTNAVVPFKPLLKPNVAETSNKSKPHVPNKVEYSQTRIEQISPARLTENRVIANQEDDPRSTPFRMLRTQVLREMRKNNWNSLAITAPTSGAGKSLVAANLAVSIALEANQTVLLVDMDLRRPSIHKYFSINPEYGIRDYIENRATISEIMINPGIERLVLLPGKKGVFNTSELLAMPRVSALIDELKTRYESRILIFDLPPLLAADDALVFFPYIDCSLLIVEDGKSTKTKIEDSLHMLKQTNLLGTVLNKGQDSGNDYYY